MNAFKVFVNYHVARRTKNPKHWGLPLSLTFEPTTACNLGCPECPSGLRQFTRPTGNLKLSTFESALDELSPYLWYVLFYFQGEPFIHPDFLKLVRAASDKNLYTATSTNAHFINDTMADDIVKSGLDRLIISIDGTSQETYEKYRVNGDLEKVLSGTKRLVAAKKRLQSHTPMLIFQFLVVRHNEHQIEEVKSLGKELGVDKVWLKTAQINDMSDPNNLVPTIDKYARYRKQSDGTYALKNKLLNQCWRLWSSSVITWDGRVVPCCFDKDASHNMGNATESGFKAVWNNAGYHRFRSALLQSRKSIDICKNCTEGTKVWND